MGTENRGKTIQGARYSVEQVADYFVYLASQKMVDEGVAEGVTPLKLQKFLYFGQSASLALYDKKLFKEDIEAWKYGPVVPTIYHKFKVKPNHPIQNVSGAYKKITDKGTQEFIKGIWELFDKYSAGELVEITHNHAPWKTFYKEGKNVVIPVEILRDYYKGIFEFSEKSNGR